MIGYPGIGSIRDPPTFGGTADWKPFSRTWAVPVGADVTVSVLLTAPGRCDVAELTAAPVDPGWRTEVFAAFTYHILPGDDVPAADRTANQRAYDELVAWFGLAAGPKVDFWKYPDNATKGEFTGDAGNGHAVIRDRAIHSIWSRDRHELVHLLATGWGTPQPLLGEGLAVWLSGAWQGQPVTEYARNLGEEWIPLDRLVDAGAFRAADGRVAYAEAGALVGWLLETRGKEALKGIYGSIPRDGHAEAWESALGASLGQVDAQVRAWSASER
jgi:hypothetical protein